MTQRPTEPQNVVYREGEEPPPYVAPGQPSPKSDGGFRFVLALVMAAGAGAQLAHALTTKELGQRYLACIAFTVLLSMSVFNLVVAARSAKGA